MAVAFLAFSLSYLSVNVLLSEDEPESWNCANFCLDSAFFVWSVLIERDLLLAITWFLKGFLSLADFFLCGDGEEAFLFGDGEGAFLLGDIDEDCEESSDFYDFLGEGDGDLFFNLLNDLSIELLEMLWFCCLTSLFR